MCWAAAVAVVVVVVVVPRHVPPLPPPLHQTRLPIPFSGVLAEEHLACLSLPICVPRVDRTASLSSLLVQTAPTLTASKDPGPVSSTRSARLDTSPLQMRCCGGAGGAGGGGSGGAGGAGGAGGDGDYRSRVRNGVGVAALLVVTTVPAAARVTASPVTNVATVVAPAVRP